MASLRVVGGRNSRGRGRRRFGRARNALTTNFLAKRALAQIKPEIKIVNLGVTGGSLSTTYAISPQALMVQGTDQNQRIGSRIRVESYIWKGFMSKAVAANNMVATLMIVVDHFCQGVTLDMNQLLVTTGAGVDHYAPRNLNYINKYDIVWRKTFNLDSNTSIADFEVMVRFNKGKGIIINYSGNTGTIADITEKAIFIVAWSDQATATGAMTHSHRLRFVDV